MPAMASPLGLEPRTSDAVSRQHIHDAQLVCDLVRLLGVENLLARPTPVEHFALRRWSHVLRIRGARPQARTMPGGTA